MRTMARTDGDGFVLNGAKMRITNSPIADVAVVWAKLESVYTYEGINEVHNLVIGRGLTGLDAL